MAELVALSARSRLFGSATELPGPVGENNRLTWRSCGLFVAISPWNFPLAIFVGQIAAALMAVGPNYLSRFALEQTVTIHTAAIGGNAASMTAWHDRV